MRLLVPLVLESGEECWSGPEAPGELERWLERLESAGGSGAVVAADEAGSGLLNETRRGKALRIRPALERKQAWFPPGGHEALRALLDSSIHVPGEPVLLVNPRLAPLDAGLMRSFISEGARAGVPLATVRTPRDHPCQVRVHVFIESVALVHILEPWPRGLEDIPEAARDLYAATRPFPFNWHAKLATSLTPSGPYGLSVRNGQPVYSPLGPGGFQHSRVAFLPAGESMARLAVPARWTRKHPLVRGGESLAGIACPAGRLDRNVCLVTGKNGGPPVLRVIFPPSGREKGACVQVLTDSGVHSEVSWIAGDCAGFELPGISVRASAVAAALFREGGPGESELVLPVMAPSHSLVTASGRMMSPGGVREYAGRQDLPELLVFDGAAVYLPSAEDGALRKSPRGFVLDDEKSLLVRSGMDRLRAAALERAMGESVHPAAEGTDGLS